MGCITLTKGLVSLVDDEDYERFSRFSWFAQAAGDGFCATRRQRENGKKLAIYLHREIVNAPIGLEVDHINGNPLDNRRSNLRLCTHAQNMANRKQHKHSAARFKGVRWCRDHKKWRAEIYVRGKRIHLGYFANDEDAAKAYNEAATLHFGEFARPNEVKERKNAWT